MDGKEASEAMSLHLEVSQFAVFLHESLRKFTARWLGESTGSLAAQLVTGMAGLESARPGWEIRKLAGQAETVQARPGAGTSRGEVRAARNSGRPGPRQGPCPHCRGPRNG